MGTLTGDTPELEGHCPHKLSTSCRLTASPKCCACQDMRPHTDAYSTYVDGLGMVNRGTRHMRYCWFCKEFWENRIAATDPPIDPKHAKIPEEPDQTEFLARWSEYHRGYRMLGTRPDGSEERVMVTPEMPWKDVSPGHLPSRDPVRRLVTTRGIRPEGRREQHVSLDSTLDSLLQEASEEQHESSPSSDRHSYVRLRERRARAFQSNVPTSEQVQQAQARVNGASQRRRRILEQLAEADADLRQCSQRHAQLLRERRTAENLERVFGTREEVRESGSEYVSPLLSMFSRAYDRYAVAEEVRAEERASDRNVTRHRQQVQDLVQQTHGMDLIVGEQREDETLEGRLRTLDDETADRPPPLKDEDMIIKLGCKICLQQKADTAVHPCGHLVMCSWCAIIAVPTKREDQTQPLRKNIPCPLCRKAVKKVARVYTA